MASIADILIAKGNAAAAGTLQRGNIYADLIRNLSSIPGQAIQQQRQLEQDQLKKQELQQNLQVGQQNLQLGGQRLAANQRDLDAQAIIGQVPRKADGTIDVDAAAELARQHDPVLVPHVTQLGQKLNTATSDYQTAQMKADEIRADRLGDVGLQLMQQPTDLGSFQLAVSTLAEKGLIPKESTTDLLKNAVDQPGFIAQQAQQWVRGSKEARAATAAKVVMQKPDEVPLIQQPLPGGGVSLTPAPGITPIPKEPTEATLNDRAQKLYTKKALNDAKQGPPLSTAEAAELTAYEQRKQGPPTQQEMEYDAFAKTKYGNQADRRQLTTADYQDFAKNRAKITSDVGFQQHMRERQFDVANPIPEKAKSQDQLEQEYRAVLTRGLSSRSGGLGLEDAKVQQANHLLALLDQARDPKTGRYNIPNVQQTELAMGLAKLVSPGGVVGQQMTNEINQRTAKGDIAGLLTYLTGTPVAGTPQDLAQMYKDSITRQGQVAMQNREGEMAYLRGLAPTTLEESRRQQLEATMLNPLRGSQPAAAPLRKEIPGHPGTFAISTDGGVTWKAE